jgi:hypothetical protein
MNGCLLAKFLRTFYRQPGRRLAVESSDLPPCKKSSDFQPLFLDRTQSLTISVFKKSAVVSKE